MRHELDNRAKTQITPQRQIKNNERDKRQRVDSDEHEPSSKQLKIYEVLDLTNNSPGTPVAVRRNKENEAVKTTPTRTDTTASTTTTTFTRHDKLNFFQNVIGGVHTSNSPAAAAAARSPAPSSVLDDTLGDKIDMHMCNRQTAIFDTPPVQRFAASNISNREDVF